MDLDEGINDGALEIEDKGGTPLKECTISP